MYAIGSLSETIKMFDDISANIEPMLKDHVLPFLTCDNVYLRHRACWVYGEFCDFEFSDQSHVAQAVEGIYKCLFDQSLATKFSAALSLSKFCTNETAQGILLPQLKNVLEVFLKMMDQIDSE